MIETKREGRTCTVKLNTSINWTFDFTYTCSDEAYAAFLHQDIREGLNSFFSRIREDAYNQGWDDKTKEKLKQGWFSGQSKII